MPALVPSFPENFDVDLAALAAAAEPWAVLMPVPDQRIQSRPDTRTIRFYQTSGLLDRPDRYAGRIARYGRRHLLQLVAIRALQSRGMSLSQVQASLSGATDRELHQVVAETLGSTRVEVTPRPYQSATESAPVASSQPPASLLVAVELCPGVVVTIDSRIHSNSAHTVTVLRRALARASETSHDVSQGD